MALSLSKEAETMLKWYQGEKRLDDSGNVTYQNIGLIGKLARQAQELSETSNLGQRFLGRTFSNFDKHRDENAFNTCVSYAGSDRLFTAERNSLVLLGGVGTGKTHLAASIVNLLLDKGIPVLFGTYIEHLEKLRQEFNTNGERTYLARMKSVPLLVLDDVGKEKQSDWTRQVMFDVINHRYEHMAPLVITTNLGKRELESYMGAATYSRLCEMSGMIETKGQDNRRNSG